MARWRNAGLLTAMAALVTTSLVGVSQVAMGSSITKGVHGVKRDVATGKPLVIVPSPNGTYSDNFNPLSPAADYATLGLIYEPLFVYSNVSTDVYPALGVKKSWNNAGTELTVALRSNAKWSDGQPFTSEDVVFSFNLLKKYPASDTNGIWKSLVSVAVNGPHQVVFKFAKPNVPMEWYVLGQTYMVPQHIWASLGDPTKSTNVHPIGTGPYELTSFDPQVYKLKPNPYFYGGKLAVPEIDFPAYTSNDSADLALAKGDIDWAGIFIPSIQNVYASRSQHNKYWFPPGNVIMLYTNLQDPLLSQLPVREAISYGIDRSQIAAEGEYGYTSPASPTGLILPNNNAWVAPGLTSSEKSFSFDPAKAVQILQKAGYKRGADGIFVSPSGKRLSFTLQVVSGWTDWDTTCALIANQLKKIGIEVKVQELSFGAYFSDINSPKKDYQLAISWTNSGPTPYYLYYNFLGSNGSFNVEQWKNAATDQTLAEFAGATTPAAQKQAIYKLEKIVADQLPAIPLFYGPVWYEYNDQNYAGWPSASNPYVTPAPFSNPAQEIVLEHLKAR